MLIVSMDPLLKILPWCLINSRVTSTLLSQKPRILCIINPENFSLHVLPPYLHPEFWAYSWHVENSYVTLIFAISDVTTPRSPFPSLPGTQVCPPSSHDTPGTMTTVLNTWPWIWLSALNLGFRWGSASSICISRHPAEFQVLLWWAWNPGWIE